MRIDPRWVVMHEPIMKHAASTLWRMLAALLLSVGCAFAQSSSPTSTIAPPRWPMEFLKDGVRLVVYQPQLASWTRYRDLAADTAVSVTPRGAKPVLGVVSWHATTLVDTQARIVAIRDITLSSARFPSVDATTAAAMERIVRDTYPAGGMTIGLDRMLAGVKEREASLHGVDLGTKPPPIVYSTTPAIVLFIDGEPIRMPIAGTRLEYVVNTSFDLFHDEASYYLRDGRTWLVAHDLAGPWTIAKQLPADFARLPAGENWDDAKASLPLAATGTRAPRVVLAHAPTELLLFAGEPVYRNIAGTHLGYATNTEQDVFIRYPERDVYVLLAGRWFRARSLDGPWAYAGNDLPDDFARIPPTHPLAHVLASVPGTQAARDAALLARVPTTAIVDRAQAEAAVKVAYAGDPDFQPIEGTSLAYAVNTQERVIRVGDLYYLCFQGVWFVSRSPTGPWKTADSVPAAIYAIPPTSPVYNVTYVTVTNATPTTVETSYTAGYAGVFLLGTAVGACIAYGTGYVYPPYYAFGPYPYPVYYPYPYTYGHGAIYNPATGFYAVGGAVYGPYAAAGRAAWYNPATGRYGRVASVQTAYGGRTVAQAYNPWTGTYAATAQGHNAYAQWGQSVVQRGDDWARAGHVTTDRGTAAHYQTSGGGSGTIISGGDSRGGVIRTGDDTVYAGKDGNVYKRDPNGGWSKYDNGNWAPVQRSDAQRQARTDASAGTPRAGAPSERAAQRQGTAPERRTAQSETMRQLDADAAARAQGAARERAYSTRSFDRSGAARGGRGARR